MKASKHRIMEIDKLLSNAFREQYQLIDLLAKGANGVVYRAKQKRLNRLVAVKFLLLDQYLGDPEGARRFRREARILSGLSHPNIVKIYEFGNEGELYYIVEELLQGIPLNVYIQKNAPAPIDESLLLAVGIADGLEYAHSHKIIHRDLKPANVVLNDSTVKIIDFGLARKNSDATRLTQTGAILGTPLYMAPETLEGTEASKSADCYALGIILYEMLTGSFPFPGNSLSDIIYAKLNNQGLCTQSLEKLDIPSELKTLVRSLLVADPLERLNDSSVLASSIRRIQQEVEKRTNAKDTLSILGPDFTTETGSGKSRPANGQATRRTLLLLLAIPLTVFAALFVCLRTDRRAKCTQYELKTACNSGMTWLEISITSSKQSKYSVILQATDPPGPTTKHKETRKYTKSAVARFDGIPADTRYRVKITSLSLDHTHGSTSADFYTKPFAASLHFRVSDIASVTPVSADANDDYLVACLSNGNLVCYPMSEPDKRLLIYKGRPGGVLINKSILYTTSGEKVSAFDLQSGKKIWEKEFDFDFSSKLFFSNGYLVIKNKHDRILVLDSKNGAARWTRYHAQLSNQCFVFKSFLILSSSTFEAPLFNLKTGCPFMNSPFLKLGTGIIDTAVSNNELYILRRPGQILVGTPEFKPRIKIKVPFFTQRICPVDSRLITLVQNDDMCFMQCFAVSDGSPGWKKELDYPHSHMICLYSGAGKLFVIMPRKKILAVEPSSGMILWTKNGRINHEIGVLPVKNRIIFTDDSSFFVVSE